jgi:hypothetical protein
VGGDVVLMNFLCCCGGDILDAAQRAKEIRALRAKPIHILPVLPEPKQPKLHQDFMMEEMQWLAKEFSRERRWKVNQSRRFAGLAKRSNLDVESRAAAREKAELLKLRRRAKWIAGEVGKFWQKVRHIPPLYRSRHHHRCFWYHHVRNSARSANTKLRGREKEGESE